MEEELVGDDSLVDRLYQRYALAPFAFLCCQRQHRNEQYRREN
jgi:hypothetical protein